MRISLEGPVEAGQRPAKAARDMDIDALRLQLQTLNPSHYPKPMPEIFPVDAPRRRAAGRAYNTRNCQFLVMLEMQQCTDLKIGYGRFFHGARYFHYKPTSARLPEQEILVALADQ